jgi:hypothetical protein
LDNLRDSVGANDDQDNESDDEGNVEAVDSSDNEDESEGDDTKKQIYKASKMNPVYFEDKATKKKHRDEAESKKKMAKSEYVEQLRRELYEEPEELHLGGMLNKKSSFAR